MLITAARKRDEAFRRLEEMATAAAATGENAGSMPVALSSMKKLQENQQQNPSGTPSGIPEGTAFVVWDTETTGLGRSDCIVQLAATCCAPDGTCLALYNQLWRIPAGMRINSRAKAVHGITEDDLSAHGCDATVELERVVKWFKQATATGIPVVAFNSGFDERMLVQTARAHNCSAFDMSAVTFLCLMAASRPHSKLRTASGRSKGFKNSELFVHFFETEPAVQLHDAAGDIAVTAACYVNAHEKGWI